MRKKLILNGLRPTLPARAYNRLANVFLMNTFYLDSTHTELPLVPLTPGWVGEAVFDV